ncbi:hypothetical protein Tco_0312509 [Tanacetum coccineum]
MKSQKAGVQRLSRKFLHSEETEAFPLMVRREPGRVVVEHTLHPREKRVISKSHRYENSEGRSNKKSGICRSGAGYSAKPCKVRQGTGLMISIRKVLTVLKNSARSS